MAVWLNGKRFEAAIAPFDLADRGLLLGDGVFDTALVLGGRVAFRDAHLDRLTSACAMLGFAFPRAEAEQAMDAAALDAGTGSVRLTVTRGSGPRGIAPPPEPRPTILATNTTGSPALAFRPIRLWPTAIRRNETSPASRLKTLNYLDAVLALGEAKARGFDEALFLNTKNRVACAGTGNIFALRDGVLQTPSLAEGMLPGIVRGVLLRLGEELGFRTREVPIEPAALYEGDAVFMTNSLRLLAPVEAIGERRLAQRAAPQVRRLCEALSKAIALECGHEAASVLTPPA